MPHNQGPPPATGVATVEEKQRIGEIARALQVIRASNGAPVRLEVPSSDFVEIPDALTAILEEAAFALANGAEHLRIISEDEEVTTTEAAEMLGVSRPHLIDLLERAGIPYRMVGTHRRVARRALLDYKRSIEARSNDAFQQLVDLSNDAGLYDAH